MATDLIEKWMKVEEWVKEADSIAFDGCHKIYVLMDSSQTLQMIDYGYREGGSQMLLRREGATPEEMFQQIHDWYDESCDLKFVNAVSTVEGNPNDGFETLIGQWDDVDEDDDWDEDNDNA